MFQYFEEFLKLADIENKQRIITGDLNCNLIEQVRSTCTAKLLEIFDLYLLKQHIQSPTRITVRSQSLIDVIITSIDDNKIIDSGVLELGISDHHLVHICRKVSLPKESPKIIFSRRFKNFNVNQFKEDLRNNINTNITMNDPNILWNDWKTKFLTIAVKFTSAAYDSANKRDKNYVSRFIKTAKEDYFKTQLGNAKNSYDSWQAINSLLNKKSKFTQISELNVGNRSVKGDENIASSFNDYFSTIGAKLANNLTDIDSDPMRFVPYVSNTFSFRNISAHELMEAVAQIKTNKSPGIDGISAKLLKDAGDTISESLANIFNLSLQSGTFPDDWKLARITPIYKDGSKTECGNYRPISVISIVAKVFEKLVYSN